MNTVKVRLLWIVKNIEEIIGCISFAGMALVTTYNVVTRYLLRGAKGWAEELAVMLLIWTTFMGAAACYKRSLHATMDFLVVRLPKKAQYWLRVGITVVLTVFFAYMTVISWEFTTSISKTTTFFKLSYRYLDIAAVLGFLSMFVYSCVFLYEAFAHPDAFTARNDARYGTLEDEDAKPQAAGKETEA